MSDIEICQVNWQDNKQTLKDIRNQVFIQEQNVAPELEWDDQDPQAQHFIARIDGQAVGCARLIDNTYIGRMAVLASHRTQGIGKHIVQFIKQLPNQQPLELSAQCHAFMFYYSQGFTANSDIYNDADIPHISMNLTQDHANKYIIGKDTKLYKGSNQLEATGHLDLLLSQTKRSISISLKDLHHPLCEHDLLIETIKKLAKKQRYFSVHILLNFYHPTYNDHPLFKLQSRLPSFVEIKLIEESIPCQWVFDGKARFDYEHHNSRTCFYDPLKTRPFMERFNKWWHSAKSIQHAKQLHI